MPRVYWDVTGPQLMHDTIIYVFVDINLEAKVQNIWGYKMILITYILVTFRQTIV